MATAEERVSRLEGAYEHMAPKAEFATLKGDLGVIFTEVRTDVADLKVDVAALKTAVISECGHRRRARCSHIWLRKA